MAFCGHNTQYAFLEQVITHGVPHHVFLFTGPVAVGKRTLAEHFATAVVQEQALTRSLQYDVNAWRDIYVLAPVQEEKKGKMIMKGISVEQVRALRKKLALSATDNKRVVIIDDIHTASDGAQNALLKTLEEPHNNTLFLLITPEPERVLPTIMSRALRVDFGLVEEEMLLTMEGATPELITRAVGRPGMLHAMIVDDAIAEETEEALTQLATLKTLSVGEKMALAEHLAKDPVRLQRTLMLWIWRIREIATTSQRYSLLFIVERIAQAYHDICTTPVNKRLRVEELLLHL